MKEKDKLLFCQICLTFILTRGRGINAKPPSDIIDLQYMSLNPSALWKRCSMMVKARVKSYCETWDLPFDEWKAFLEGGEIPKSKKQKSPMSKEITADMKMEQEKKINHKEFCRCPDCRKEREEIKSE